VLDQWLEAQRQIVRTTSARLGIRYSNENPFTSPFIEIVTKNYPYGLSAEYSVFMESWVVDRRNGANSYELTYPFARMSVKADQAGTVSYKMEVIDLEDK
jgi:hypothetical protein